MGCANEEYWECVCDLFENSLVKSMENFMQHHDVDCLHHCIYVSYTSYRLCKRLGFDYVAAARGGLLHDFFLYDWHSVTGRPYKGLHGFHHPRVSLENANKHFELNLRKQDIIVKHMWPLTLKPPKYKESVIIMLVDKYCAIMEILRIKKRESISEVIGAYIKE